MAYYVVDPIDIESPVGEGLYELEGGAYVPSEDLYPDAEKTYYDYEEDEEPEEEDDYEEIDVEPGEPLGDGVYELFGGEYVPTEDTTAVSGKSYYVYTVHEYEPPVDIDKLYYVFDDPVADPSAAGLFERTEDGRYLPTEDTVYDADKVYYMETGELVKEEIEDEDQTPYYPPSDIVIDGVRDPEEATIASGMNMVYAWTAHVSDPSAEGFYEIVDGAYVLTQDTELVKGKTYYEHYVYNDYYEADMTGVANPSFWIRKYYELVNGEYVVTSDTSVDPGKTYYRSHKDDDEFYVPDPVVSARRSGS